MGTPRLDRLDRNLIINGAMDFWQRVGGNITTNNALTANYFTADRIRTAANGAGTKNFSISRSSDVPTLTQAGVQFSNSINFNCITALASFASDAALEPVLYTVEGYDYAAIHGKPATLGFWVKAAVAGPYSAVFRSNAFARVYSTLFTVNAANTWEYKTITLTMDTVSSDFTNAQGVAITLGNIGGAGQVPAANNVWGTNVDLSVRTSTGATNWMATAGNYIRFTGLSLVEGTSGLAAGSFVRAGRTIGEELSLCQRYYEKSYHLESAPGAATSSGTGGIRGFSGGPPWLTQVFSTWKRAAPTIVLYDWGGNANRVRINAANNVSGYSTDSQFGNFSVVYNSNVTEILYHWTADAEIT